MASSRIIEADGMYDLSNINTLKELEDEIYLLKADIKKNEHDLSRRLQLLPKHIVKSTADNLFPSFLNKMIANGTWKLLLSSITMFANPFSKGFSFKKNIVSSAKRLGLITLAKSAYSMWSSKRVDKTKPVAGFIKPNITTLKTKNLKRN